MDTFLIDFFSLHRSLILFVFLVEGNANHFIIEYTILLYFFFFSAAFIHFFLST